MTESIDRSSLPRPKVELTATRLPGCYELRPAVIRWPISDPILSDRDQKLQPLASFKSPFRLRAARVGR